MSRGRAQAELTETTHAWLLTLRRRIAEVEEDTQDAFRVRRQLVRHLVAGIMVGKRHEGRGTHVRITYRFGPPPAKKTTTKPVEKRIRLWLLAKMAARRS